MRQFYCFLCVVIAAMALISPAYGQSPDDVESMFLNIRDDNGPSYVFFSDSYGKNGCSADTLKQFLEHLKTNYPQISRFANDSRWPLLVKGGITIGSAFIRMICSIEPLSDYRGDLAIYQDAGRTGQTNFFLVHWKPSLKDPLAVHTASGQAPSKASAVNAARDLATSGYGNTIRKWGDSNCTQGTKLASQYGTARVTQWTCNIEFQTAATDPDGVARNAGGKGDTEDGAIANAKSLATAGLLPSQIKSWDDPICSTQQEHASRYNSTQMKTVWVCAVGYTTYQ